ncbi:MAG: DUF983 domain-containing protein [Pseudomonadota bacterium]
MDKPVSPLVAGLKCRCPECGEGPVFETYLGLASRCTVCGADFSSADAGDGPAFFVMFLISILVTPAVLLVQAAFAPPIWLQAVIWSPVILLLALWLLRPFKATLFALQWKNRAEEAKWADGPGDD